MVLPFLPVVPSLGLVKETRRGWPYDGKRNNQLKVFPDGDPEAVEVSLYAMF
jgi:hypothetical protein